MRNLIRPTMGLTVSNVLTRLAGMVFFVILARLFTVGDYGFYRYLITVATLFSVFFTGFPTALTKFVGENKKIFKRNSRYLSNTIFLMVIVYVLAAFAILLIYRSNAIYVSLFLFSIFVDFMYRGWIRGALDYWKLFGFKLVENILQIMTIALFFLVSLRLTFLAAVLIYSFSGFASLLIFEFIKKSKVELSIHFLSAKIMKRLTYYSIPVLIGGLGLTATDNVNFLFIKHFSTNENLAFFSVGLTVVQVFTFAPLALSTLLMPKVAASKNHKTLVKNVNRMVLLNFLVSFCGLALLLLVGRQLITLIFGYKYLQSYSVIFFLAFGQIFESSHQVYCAALQGMGTIMVPSSLIILGCVVNICAAFILTPLYGIVGTSLSFFAASALTFVLITHLFNHHEIRA